MSMAEATLFEHLFVLYKRRLSILIASYGIGEVTAISSVCGGRFDAGRTHSYIFERWLAGVFRSSRPVSDDEMENDRYLRNHANHRAELTCLWSGLLG